MSEHPILKGSADIAGFLLGDRRQTKTVHAWIDRHDLPIFRVGKSICARPETLRAWCAAQEANGLDQAKRDEALGLAQQCAEALQNVIPKTGEKFQTENNRAAEDCSPQAALDPLPLSKDVKPDVESMPSNVAAQA